jgi:hypothetical protein
MADYGPLYSAAGNQFNIDPLLLQSMAVQESNQGQNTRPSSAGAKGFMQFRDPTAAQYGVDTADATSSVFGASHYMNDLMNQHGESLPHALADYSGSTPDSAYVRDVTARYNALKAAWAKTGPGTSSAGPSTDTDPASPTYGQPTGKNFTPPASTPDTDTTAKGNPGQPAPSVPTTDTETGISIAAPGFEPPSGGGPSGQRQAQAPAAKPSEKNDPLSQAKPHVNEDGTPIVPAQAAPAEAGDPLSRAQPQVSESGEAIKPVDTGEYLTSATSPGAQAVGTPPVEGRMPGPAFQAAINIATDPAQKARIAASQLGIPLDRIIAGPRMAAVDDRGQPYYIEPQPVFNAQPAITRDASGAWNPAPGFISPYSRAPALGPGATAANIPLAMGGAIPGTVQNYLTWAPAAIGGPILGPSLVGASSLATTAGRNALANYLDPDKSQAVPLLTPQDTKQALINAGMRLGGEFVPPGITLRPGEAPIPTSPTATQWPVGGGIGQEETNRLATSTQFPGRQPMPVGPNEPITGPRVPSVIAPGAAPGEPGVQLNPAGEAAAASGPYAPSRAEEVAAIPTAVPVSRKPILTQGQAATRADELIRYFAAQGPTEADTRNLVPGSTGTLAGVTGNAGLASLERLVRNIPEAANRFAGADTANREAERSFTANLVGTPDDVARAEAQRDTSTSAAREAAFANKTPTDPSAAVADIDKVLQGPAGKRPNIALPLRHLRGLFFDVDPATGAQVLETDPEMLYGVRQAITDALSPMSRGTERYAAAASSQLQNVLGSLDNAIEAGAPGFKDYLSQFHDLSQPITSMKFLQSRNLTDAQGYPLLRPVDTLLKDIQKQRTLQPGVRPADALSDDQISQLENLRDDLRRGANLGKGKALGSNTAQNLVGNQTLNMLTRPAAQEVGKAVATTFGGLPGYLVSSGVENALSGAVQRRQGWVLDALVDRLLNKDNLGVSALGAAPGSVP